MKPEATEGMNEMFNERYSKAAKTSNFPSYLFNPPTTTLGLEELRKHGIISDIEKKRAVTRFLNKATVLVPLFHNVLCQMDKSQTGQTNTDHDYQVHNLINYIYFVDSPAIT